MPISATTPFAAGAVMSAATLNGNNALIESFLNGEVAFSDLKNDVTQAKGVAGSNHRVYIGQGNFNSRRVMEVPFAAAGADQIDTVRDELDSDSVLDILALRKTSTMWDAPLSQFIVTPEQMMNNFVWERLGNLPENIANPADRLTTNPHSVRNWIHNVDPATITTLGYIDEPHHADRFGADKYYDRWVTVPFCSQRIWVPGPCTLYVSAHAVGTFSHCLDTSHEWDAGLPTPAGWTGLSPTNEMPTNFRLFVDSDNHPTKLFQWRSGHPALKTYKANWTSVDSSQGTTAPIVMLGVHRDFTVSCLPRGTMKAVGHLFIPRAGYYNVSLRYNTPYFFGCEDSGLSWARDKFARLTGILNTAGRQARPGPICVSRWEQSGIACMAQFKRTTLAKSYTSSDF